MIPPPQPAIAPVISDDYLCDSNKNRIEDRLESKIATMAEISRSVAFGDGQQAIQPQQNNLVKIELIFTAPITQQQIDDFLALGGEITYIYQAVSYGWNGRISLDKIDTISSLMGAALVLIEEQKPASLHMRLATQTGRVRPVWANGFAASSGYDGNSNISIAIIDSGIDDSHPDLSGRQAYWHDYTSDNELTPRDTSQHGSHVAGIALGTGASLGTGTTLYYTDSGDLTGVPAGYFYASLIDFPSVATAWTSTATWLGGGSGTLGYYYTAKGTSSSSWYSQNSTSATAPVVLNTSFTPSASNTYCAALLSNESMATYAIANSFTNFSVVGDGFNTLSGVAPECLWVGAKAFLNSGSSSSLDLNSAIDDMVAKRSTYNIKVLNLSGGIGGDPGISTTQRQKINSAANNGVLPVISAGNDGTESTSGGREIDDPGRAAMALTIGASNDLNQLTEYTSHGFSSPSSRRNREEDYKPDLLAPGGSSYYSSIMSVDSGDADGEDISFADVQSNDYYNIKGTSMSAPFAAGCAALLIDALESTSRLTGVSWNFSSSDDVRLVKMLLCATATETNANREVSSGYDPTLQRASTGPNGYPAGKDSYEGYGMINVDAAIEGGTVGYTAGQIVSDSLGGSNTARRAWARAVQLTSGTAFNITLAVPDNNDYDLYLYDIIPSSYGTPVILNSSTNATSGTNESISYTSGSNTDAILVVKWVSGTGAGLFTVFETGDPTASPAIISTPVTIAPVDQLYSYDVDANGIAELTYSLITSPAGMTINATSGLIEWTPTESQLGLNAVTVQATNSQGADTQSFDIDAAGATPVITSTPITIATIDEPYSYDVDANGTPAPVYYLIASPNGMDINSVTGLIGWVPDANQIGDVNVVVEANSVIGFDRQNFSINAQLVDDFNDNRRSAMWRLSTEDYNNVWILEDANHLNIRATGDANNLTAFYTANGWNLDANESFAVEINFHYGTVSDQNSWIGIIIENDSNYVSLSAGSDSNEPYYYYETIVDSNIIFEQEVRDSNDGTLYISYNIDSNSLSLSHIGYEDANAYNWQTTTNPIKGRWTSPVKVSIGGASEGAILDPNEAYLDNFKVTNGPLLHWPPPTDIDGDGFINWDDVAIMSTYWLADPNFGGDINGDNAVNFRDFAELGLAW